MTLDSFPNLQFCDSMRPFILISLLWSLSLSFQVQLMEAIMNYLASSTLLPAMNGKYQSNCCTTCFILALFLIHHPNRTRPLIWTPRIEQ